MSINIPDHIDKFYDRLSHRCHLGQGSLSPEINKTDITTFSI